MHVLINPMPVYGLSMGVVAMSVALIYRGRPVIVAALVVIFLSGAFGLAYVSLRTGGLRSREVDVGYDRWTMAG